MLLIAEFRAIERAAGNGAGVVADLAVSGVANRKQDITIWQIMALGAAGIGRENWGASMIKLGEIKKLERSPWLVGFLHRVGNFLP